MRGDKECPFSGVTSSGRVWRKVQESEARSVNPPLYQEVELTASTDDLLLGLLVSEVVCVDAVDAEDGIASLQTALLGDVYKRQVLSVPKHFGGC